MQEISRPSQLGSEYRVTQTFGNRLRRNANIGIRRVRTLKWRLRLMMYIHT